MNLNKKLIIVIGGSRGIGKEIVASLHEEFNIAVIFEKNFNAAKKTNEEFTNIKIYQSDVSDLNSVQSTYLKIKDDFKQTPFALVYSAGISYFMLHLMEDINQHKKLFDTNYFGLVNWTKTITSDLCREKNGRIIFLSSSSVTVNTLGLSAYCSSKLAGEKFIQIIGSELGKYGISCNIVRPGLTETEMPNALIGKLSKEQLENILLPTKEFNKANDTANAVKFLIKNSGMNSSVITIDNGHALYRNL